MKSKINLILLLSFAICLLFVSSAWAIGLAVEPAEINIKDVPLGKKVAVSKLVGDERMKLNIKNKGQEAYAYTINVLSVSETTDTLKEGYIDIPDTSWIWPENKEVIIEGQGSKVIELFLKIPKKRGYYNKKYQAVIEVKSKKNRPEETFILACQLRISFSTYGGKKGRQQEERPRILPFTPLKELPGEPR